MAGETPALPGSCLIPGLADMISIVIVNWNSGTFLANCVRSLLDNAAGNQIVIVDNGSTDSSLDFAKKWDADILVIRKKRNSGFAAGCNSGWQAGSGRYILFLNPDTEAFPDSIACLENVLSNDNSVWAVGGQLVSASGRAGDYLRPFPTVWRVASDAFFIDELFRIGRRTRQTNNCAGLIETDQPAAACLMVPRAVLEKIGGFDESFYPAWFEDVDLCRRIRNQGGRILYQPAAGFLHYGGSSLERMSRETFLEFFHTNQIRYFQKHHGHQAASKVKTLVICGLLFRSAISLAFPLSSGSSRLDSAKIFWKTARYFLHSHGARA
jgi:N-acetylglucosaminyl-diphospho-decaprenol L-rhamnosyltransferase